MCSRDPVQEVHLTLNLANDRFPAPAGARSLCGADGYATDRQDTLHAIAFILRRNRQTAPMGVSRLRKDLGENGGPGGRKRMNQMGEGSYSLCQEGLEDVPLPC